MRYEESEEQAKNITAMVNGYRPSKRLGTIVMLGPWWHAAYLTFSRSCVARGFAVHLLDVGSQPLSWKRYSSCLAGGGLIAESQFETPEGIASVHEYVRSVEADALFTFWNRDLIWLGENRSVFEPTCKVMVPPPESLRLLESKQNQIDLALRVGFDVLPTWYLWAPEDYRKIPQCHYPVALHPTTISMRWSRHSRSLSRNLRKSFAHSSRASNFSRGR